MKEIKGTHLVKANKKSYKICCLPRLIYHFTLKFKISSWGQVKSSITAAVFERKVILVSQKEGPFILMFCIRKNNVLLSVI